MPARGVTAAWPRQQSGHAEWTATLTLPPKRDGAVGIQRLQSLEEVNPHLSRSARFVDVQARPEYAPNAVVADYDLGCFPSGVTRAYLRIRWFETDDFSIHYSKQYRTGNSWECRWDRHPTDHNTREHFHPPPEAPTPGEGENYPDEWQDVLATVLTRLDERIEAFWSE